VQARRAGSQRTQNEHERKGEERTGVRHLGSITKP
jgi:hypothetical protein